MCPHRAINRDGDTADFPLSPTRKSAVAKAFFRKALRTQMRAMVSITFDDYASSQRAVGEMPKDDEAWNDAELRPSKYPNNLIKQDYHGVKFRRDRCSAPKTLIARQPPSLESN